MSVCHMCPVPVEAEKGTESLELGLLMVARQCGRWESHLVLWRSGGRSHPASSVQPLVLFQLITTKDTFLPSGCLLLASALKNSC